MPADASSGQSDADATTTPPPADAGACFTLTNSSAPITSGCGVDCDDCNGDVLADGTYIMTEYAGPLNSACNMENGDAHGKLVVGNGEIEVIEDYPGGPPFELPLPHFQLRAKYSITKGGDAVASATLNATALCGESSGPLAFGSNAKGDVLLGDAHFVRQD